MKVVTICGSMRYAKDMIVLALQLEIEKGYAVIQCVYDFNSTLNSPASFHQLSKEHF